MNEMTRFLPESFDLELRQYPFEIGGEKFVLTEASESAAIAFRNCPAQSMTLNEEGRPEKIGDYASADSLLLSRCVYFASPDGSLPLKSGEPNQDSLVSIERIRRWGTRICTPLAAQCKAMSDMDTDEDPEKLRREIDRLTAKLQKALRRKESLGNSSPGTTHTSG